jgi:hypothetical protein
MPEMPNAKSLAVGQAEELPIPVWARVPFSLPRVVANPLDMAAGSRMTALNTRRVLAIPTWPWNEGRVGRAGLGVARGAAATFNPIGYGQRYT